MMSSSNEGRKAQLLKPLRLEGAELVREIMGLKRREALRHASSGQSRVEAAINLFALLPDRVAKGLDDLAHSKKESAKAERLFRNELKITRELKLPDLLATLALISVGWTAETALTTISLASDGHVDLVGAMAVGATFSSANTGLGLVTGQALRFATYRNRAEINRPGDKLTRAFGVAGVLGSLATEAVLLLTAARVRATGEHAGVFDFSEVGLFETFNDSFAIILIVTAALSYVIATVKGYNGINDPIVGFADHVGTTGKEIADQARKLVEDTLAELNEIADAAEEDILSIEDASDDAEDLLEDVLAFNASLEEAKSELRLFIIRDWEEHCVVAGEELPQPPFDFTEFDALKIDPEELSFDAPRQQMIDDLNAARAEAAARIMTLSTGFSAKTTSGVVLSPLPTAAE